MADVFLGGIVVLIEIWGECAWSFQSHLVLLYFVGLLPNIFNSNNQKVTVFLKKLSLTLFLPV